MKNMFPKQPFPYQPPYLVQHRFGRTIKPAFPLEKRASVGTFFKEMFRLLGWSAAGAAAVGGGVYGSRALGLFNPTVVRPYLTEEMLFPIYGGIGGAGIGAGLGLLYSLAVGDEEDRKEWWKRMLFGAIIGGSFGYGIPVFYSTIAKMHAAQRAQAQQQQEQQDQQQGQQQSQQQGTQQQGQTGTVPLIAPLDIHLNTSPPGSGGSNTSQGTTQTSFVNPFSPTQNVRFAPAFGSQKMYQLPLASSILPNTLIPSLNAAKHAYLLKGARRNPVEIKKVKVSKKRPVPASILALRRHTSKIITQLSSGQITPDALKDALKNALIEVLSDPKAVQNLTRQDALIDIITNLPKDISAKITFPIDDLQKAWAAVLQGHVDRLTDVLQTTAAALQGRVDSLTATLQTMAAASASAKRGSGLGWFGGLTLAGLGGGGGLGLGYYLGSLQQAIPQAISPAAMGTVGAGLGGLAGALLTVTQKDEESRKKWFRNMLIGSLTGGVIGFGIPLLAAPKSGRG